MAKGDIYKELIQTAPIDRQEAYDKWERLSKAIQLLEVALRIPVETIEQALKLSNNK